jgi:hypothetical protein
MIRSWEGFSASSMQSAGRLAVVCVATLAGDPVLVMP